MTTLSSARTPLDPAATIIGYVKVQSTSQHFTQLLQLYVQMDVWTTIIYKQNFAFFGKGRYSSYNTRNACHELRYAITEHGGFN